MSDMFELKAIEMIARHLPAAVANGHDLEARNGMAVAQYIAGMGFSNVGLEPYTEWLIPWELSITYLMELPMLCYFLM